MVVSASGGPISKIVTQHGVTQTTIIETLLVTFSVRCTLSISEVRGELAAFILPHSEHLCISFTFHVSPPTQRYSILTLRLGDNDRHLLHHSCPRCSFNERYDILATAFPVVPYFTLCFLTLCATIARSGFHSGSTPPGCVAFPSRVYQFFFFFLFLWACCCGHVHTRRSIVALPESWFLCFPPGSLWVRCGLSTC